jgi:DNA-binding NtrC family response regulator
MENFGVRPAQVARRIAVVSTDTSVLPALEEHIVPIYHTTVLESVEDTLAHLAADATEALIYDLEVADQATDAGMQQVSVFRERHPELIIIAVTRASGRAAVQKAKQAGSDEVFQAPLNILELGEVLDTLLKKRQEQTLAAMIQKDLEGRVRFKDLLGGSEAMRHVYDAIQRVASKNVPVLIRGESGTGKELVARAIVQSGDRKDRPFVAVNCAALPENLIESELFGSEKGAFTGAMAARAGHIELADGGTLFLDEIGSLGLQLQGKLLRVIQERQVQRLGGKSPKRIDFRLITATNENLEDMVQAGKFREDLYYRIHVVPIHLPALRERKEDIPLLVNHFVQMYCTGNGIPLKKLEPEVIDILEDHDWPGNVRELENVIQRLVIMADAHSIKAIHLPQQMIAASAAQNNALLIPSSGIDFDREIQKIEIAFLTAALQRTDGRKFAAARVLQIAPQRMKYLCRKYGL